MKKLLILAAAIVAGVVANAASFNWQAANIYGADGTTKFSGTATLYAIISGVDTAVQVATASNGAVAKANTGFENANLVAGEYYDFYFVIEDGGKIFTSAKKENILAQATSTITVNFGNMQTATQAAGNWQAVPEPTSGLLLLLGMAGLALKRKRA
jgi:hypothetical protein